VLKLLQWLLARDGFLRFIAPVFGRFNPLSEQHRRDPHATWRALREEAPVYRSRAFQCFVTTRYDDVLHVLRDKNFTTDRSNVPLMKLVARLNRRYPDFAGMMERNLLTMDGVDHRRMRGLVSKAFTPRRVEALRPRIQSIVDDLLDRAAESGEIDLIEEFAHPLPVVAIAELLGVPAEDRAIFKAWSSQLVQLLDPLQGSGGGAPIRRATRELFAYFRPLLAARRADPQDDLISAMISAEENGEQLDELDLLALCGLILTAGHETTTNQIGNAVLALLRNPDERKRLVDDPALIGTAVDEFLRYEGVIQFTDRAVLEDCEIGGIAIRKGQMVVAGLAAANRDPERFPDPDRLDLGRTDNHHLSFGQGNHFCLGANLAKLEIELAMGSLVRRFPEFSGPSDPPEWRRSMIIRGPASLPVRLAG